MNQEKNRVFITGGAGFIGSHLVDRFISSNFKKITVYDNLADGSVSNIAHHHANNAFKFIEGDLADFDLLEESIKGHDFIFHFAANTDNRNETELPTDLQIKENIQNTYNVLEAMRLNGIRNIIFPSSATVYGDSNKPFAEDFGPLLPTSLYGASKLTGESFISSFHYLFGINAWIFRFSNIVGSRMNHGVIFDFITKLKKNPKSLEILGDGKQRKPFVHVQECIDAILYTITRLETGLHLFNIGVKGSSEINEIAKIVIKEMKLNEVSINYTGGKKGWVNDVPILKFNISKLKELGWTTELTSNEAVNKAVIELLTEK